MSADLEQIKRDYAERMKSLEARAQEAEERLQSVGTDILRDPSLLHKYGLPESIPTTTAIEHLNARVNGGDESGVMATSTDLLSMSRAHEQLMRKFETLSKEVETLREEKKMADAQAQFRTGLDGIVADKKSDPMISLLIEKYGDEGFKKIMLDKACSMEYRDGKTPTPDQIIGAVVEQFSPLKQMMGIKDPEPDETPNSGNGAGQITLEQLFALREAEKKAEQQQPMHPRDALKQHLSKASSEIDFSRYRKTE